MSHIPSSAMPHAHANGDAIDDKPPHPAGGAFSPEPTTATPDQKNQAAGHTTDPAPLATSATQRAQNEAPLSSAAPATTTGNRQGGDADHTATTPGRPEASGSNRPAVDGTVTAQDGATSKNHEAMDARGGRSNLRAAAIALGGLAAIGGIFAALFPILNRKPEPKSKKRKRKNS